MKKVADPTALEALSRDAGMIQETPKAAYYAETESDIVEVVGRAKEAGVPITPRGGGTAIPSQSIGKGFILLQNRTKVDLTGPSSFDCEPAVVKSELNATLRSAGLWFPVDPSSYRSCTVGGMVANNSSGTRTLKHGSTIDYVASMRVVFPETGPALIAPIGIEAALSGSEPARKVAELLLDSSAEIEAEVPQVSKNSCGYRLERVIHGGVLDLPKLFVGSEGTLGIISQLSLAARAKRPSAALLVLETSLAELDKMAYELRRLRPSAIELVDKSVFSKTGRSKRLAPYSRSEDPYLVLCEIEGEGERGPEEELARVAASSVEGFEPLVLTDPGDVASAWDVRNETLTIAGEFRSGGRILLPGVEDLTVAPERLGELLKFILDQFERRGLEYISYGHAGDANLHLRPMLDPGSRGDLGVLNEMMEECFEKVWKMKGTITGEHGDGMLRASYVARQYPRTHSLMKEIRRLFDPKGMLNPNVKIV
ncbi:MAG: FAD-binding oxidoreductase [Thaumarchaeota archaeon]|nr:FAD-binding oxidoreductase [Nitrososphaerota archaeon]